MSFNTTPPFTGKRILITRDAASNSKLEIELRQLGAEVLNWPCFETVSLIDTAGMSAAFEKLKSQNWLVFTSQNSVRHFIEGCHRFSLTFDDFKNCSFACVGSETAKVLTDAGWSVQLVPPVFSQLGLSDCKEFTQSQNLKITLLQAKAGRSDFTNLLASRHDIQTLPLYETHLLKQTAARIDDILKNGVHWILFYSPSAVNGFTSQFTTEQLQSIFNEAVPVAIGDTTMTAIKNFPVKRVWQAKESTHEGMIHALWQLNIIDALRSDLTFMQRSAEEYYQVFYVKLLGQFKVQFGDCVANRITGEEILPDDNAVMQFLERQFFHEFQLRPAADVYRSMRSYISHQFYY